MAEKKVNYTDVELTGTHTHRRKEYAEKDILRLRDDQAKHLIGQKKAKAAAQGATPVNIDKDGNPV